MHSTERISGQTILEDWEGFEALLCDTTFQEKEAIIKTITSDIHPDSKERKLKNTSLHSTILS